MDGIQLMNKDVVQKRLNRYVNVNYTINFEISVKNNIARAGVNDTDPAIVTFTDQDSASKRINKIVYALLYTLKKHYKSDNEFKIDIKKNKINYALTQKEPLHYADTKNKASETELKNYLDQLNNGQNITVALKFIDEL